MLKAWRQENNMAEIFWVWHHKNQHSSKALTLGRAEPHAFRPLKHNIHHIQTKMEKLYQKNDGPFKRIRLRHNLLELNKDS